jgi:hypothetical protein
MPRATQPVDLHNSMVEQALCQMIKLEEDIKCTTMVASNESYYTIYPWVCISNGKIPISIKEHSLGLNELAKRLCRISVQDLCNTKQDWENSGLLLNVDDSVSTMNPRYCQYFNMQGMEIDEIGAGIKCVVKYLSMFPPELVAPVNHLIWSKLCQYFEMGLTNIDEDHV